MEFYVKVQPGLPCATEEPQYLHPALPQQDPACGQASHSNLSHGWWVPAEAWSAYLAWVPHTSPSTGFIAMCGGNYHREKLVCPGLVEQLEPAVMLVL